MPAPFISLPPNRVRRNYLGGKMLDVLAKKSTPIDANQPEDWIASTIEARNPGLAEVEKEGLAWAMVDGKKLILKDLFALDPEYYLGAAHFSKLQNELGFLTKLLDSSMRLHLQAHPTAEFAQKKLQSQWGKLETYTILGVRPEAEGYIWLGFQQVPTAQEWERIVLTQDLEAMHRCFEKVPVKAGQVWVIPGGMPHAIGEGVFVLEVMEPTDLVVRCEFEREGIVVPPEARFMGMDPKASLAIFDFTQRSLSQIQKECQVKPRIVDLAEGSISEVSAGSKTELLIGPEQTDCFTIRRCTTDTQYSLDKNEVVYIGIVASGSGFLEVDGSELILVQGDTFLIPAAQRQFELRADGEDSSLEVLFCSPGYGIEKI